MRECVYVCGVLMSPYLRIERAVLVLIQSARSRAPASPMLFCARLQLSNTTLQANELTIVNEMHVHPIYIERETERERERETERQTERQTETDRDRDRDREYI